MAFCRQCGYQLREGAAFCPQCGTKTPTNANASFAGRPGVVPAAQQPATQQPATQQPATQQPATPASAKQPAAQVAAQAVMQVVNPALQALREAIVVMGGPGIAEVGEVAAKGETIISAWQGR